MPPETKEKKSKPGRPATLPLTTPADPIYTDEAAALVLNCNLRVLQEKFREKEIMGYKKLGKWYTLHSDIITYLKS